MPPATEARRRRAPRALPALVLCSALLVAARAGADPQPPDIKDAAGIRLALDKLNVVGSALYVAAHPDDENTALLALLGNGRKVRAAYLSVTRGDGGQNLIGSDTGELLGVIRTQELLAARRIDGAEQFFTRALDFGFSKGPDETLQKWDKERILSDVVWVLRRFRPDVVIAGFATDGSGGHGHHTASAILAEEAFAAAADPKRFPDQLTWVRPWQAKRLVRNVGRGRTAPPDTTPGRVSVDLGAYDAVLGRSFTELAGESRSMHKSQGFGAPERRGAFTITFEHRAGEKATRDLFDGVDLSWSRVKGGAPLTALFARAAREFDPAKPAAIVPVLLRAHAILAGLPDEPIVEKKRAELLEVIRSCAGLWLEATALRPYASPGARIDVVTSALNRSDLAMRLEGVTFWRDGDPRREGVDMVGRNEAHVPPVEVSINPDAGFLVGESPLAFNATATDTFPLATRAEWPTSEPYWLRRRPLAGSFDVETGPPGGSPENPPALTADFHLVVAGQKLRYTVPVAYRWVDPVAGERWRAFDIVPPVTMRFDHGVYLFADATPREIAVTATSADTPVDGKLSLRLPQGWSAVPAAASVRLAAGETDTTVRFLVTPGGGAAAATVGAEMEIGGKRHDRRLVRLDYPHVPIQTLLPPAEAHLVRSDLRTIGHMAGYIMGSGDQGAEALEQMGYEVTMLTDEDVERLDLRRFDVIVTGVRAYNTRPRLRGLQRRLLDYVTHGGRLVVQYNTAEPAIQNRLGPAPFQISRDRVTVEEAPVELKVPDHPLLATPNRIGPADFDGWVQERGLYFASPFDARYETPLTSHDPGEPARDGGLLYARQGKGTFIYVAYAFFRQLPAGVPGAWRLFANLVSAPPPPRP
ncbi:MAG TPA: PIG-L family deacetylase [Candidatus Eisenbacteria bacterium]|nr:PIG-L family deacetylase [Candidatus Eisenbacteria bacterium]